MTKRNTEERELQDYLDGRLSEEERKRFEARLEREPELARRVESSREIGEALREDDEALSPGFYTRTRAAFEESSKGRESRSWFRPLSWETAGLVAVVLVAAALYVPELVRSPSVREAFEEPKTIEVRKYTPPKPVAAGDAMQDGLEQREAPAEPEGAAALRYRDESQVVAEQSTPSKPSDAEPTPAPPSVPEGLGAVEKKEAPRTGGARDKGEDHEGEEAWAPSPPATARVDEEVPAAPVPERAAPEAKRRPAPAAEKAYTEADAARQSWESAAALGGSASDGPLATPLPPGLVEPGALRVIEEAEEWDALLAASADELLAGLDGYGPSSRLVLIGTRPEPFDCASISVVATDTEYRILLSPPVEGGRAAEHGCAMLLPRDGRTIEVFPGAAD